jgi:cyanophycinase
MSVRFALHRFLVAGLAVGALMGCAAPAMPTAFAAANTASALASASRVEAPLAPLMLVGGGRDQDDIMRHFLKLASGVGPIVVVPLASGEPAKSGQAYVDYLRTLGNPDARYLIPTGEPTEADRELLAEAGGVFFSGGDQTRIFKAMGPAWQKALKGAWQHGAVLAGTSAGAMIWGGSAILEGDPMQTGWHGEDPDFGGIRLGTGFGFVPSLVVDTHFSERGRMPRLAYAVAKRPGGLGLGVDPQTAAVMYPNGRLEVLGRGTVTVVEVPPQPVTAPLSLKNMKVHLLSAGDQLNLSESKTRP